MRKAKGQPAAQFNPLQIMNLFGKQTDSSPLNNAKEVVEYISSLKDFNMHEEGEGTKDGLRQVVSVPWVSRGQAWLAFYIAKNSGLNPTVIGNTDDYSEEFSINIPVREWLDGSGFVCVKILRQGSNTFIGKGGRKDYKKERWTIKSTYSVKL